MKLKLSSIILFILWISVACGKPEENIYTTESEEDTENSGGENEENPPHEPGYTITEFKDNLGDGKYCSGFIAEIDFKANPNLKFNTIYTVPKKTPTYIFDNFEKDKGEPRIVANGGYFAGTTSMSLAVIDGRVKCPHPRAINWPNDENYQCTVYPVRSAIGRMPDGSFEIKWVYCTNVSFQRHCAFPSAMGNNEKTKTFLTEPLTDYTPGAVEWKPEEAIGGGPRLVQNGKDVAVENYWAEVFDSGGTAGLSRQPRTGVGITEDNRLILIVCDGRGMNGSSGFTLSELAKKFISLGTVDAMNLDGGGSSQIVGPDGNILNRPSDTGNKENIVERKLVTSIVISELTGK